MRRLLRTAAALAVTGLCVGLVAVELEPSTVGAVVAGVEPTPLILALAVALTLPFWRGARLAALLPRDRRPGGGRLTRLSAEVLLWSFLLPFKLGELSFPWLLHRRAGLPLGEAAALFVLVRASDLFAVAGLLAVGASTLAPIEARGLGGLALVLGAGLLLAPLGLIAVAVRWRDRLGEGGGRLARLVAGASHARTARARLVVLGTTAGLWGSHVAIAVLALAATATAVDLAAAAAASAAGNLAFALPVTGVLGLGPQQVAFAGTLELAGVAWSRAVAVALVVHAVVTVAAVAAGLSSWLMARRAARPPASVRRLSARH